MSLMNRYIAEVGRHLPEKDRSDIEAEIRSMVEDMVEERQGEGKSANVKVVTEALEQLGDPKLLAAKYAPPRRYLIGPGWYDVYIKTLQRIILLVLPFFAVVTFTLTLARNPLDFINAFGEAIGGALDVGLQILFWVTLVFVLMERSDALPGESLTRSPEGWTVARLPELPQKRQIPIGEAMVNLVMTLFVMMWIVLPTILSRLQGESGPAPFFHPDLWTLWLPLLLVLLALTFIHDVSQLKIGRWTPALTITNVIMGVITIAYIMAFVTTQEIINPGFLATLNEGAAGESAKLVTWGNWSVNITAAIIVGIYVWDIVNSIRLSRQLER